MRETRLRTYTNMQRQQQATRQRRIIDFNSRRRITEAHAQILPAEVYFENTQLRATGELTYIPGNYLLVQSTQQPSAYNGLWKLTSEIVTPESRQYSAAFTHPTPGALELTCLTAPDFIVDCDVRERVPMLQVSPCGRLEALAEIDTTTYFTEKDIFF